MAATYTVKQVADILGYSTNSIYTFLKAKRIKGVRVGKGRFRIPQSELDRLLLISKKQNVPASAMISGALLPPAPAVGISDITGSIPIEDVQLFGFAHLGTLNIFDWFIGTAAIIAGLSLFLFNASFNQASMGQVAMFLSVIRVTLIGSGAGILLTNIAGQTHKLWHKLFHILLGSVGVFMGIVFFAIGEIDGSLIYGILGVLVFLSAVIHIGGAAWFSLYMSLLTVATTLALLLAGRSPHITQFLAVSPFSPSVLVIMAVVSGLMMIVTLWIGYFRSKQLFWLVTWIMAFWYFGIAFWYGAGAYWSRSFFFLVVGMTGLFVYPWESLVNMRSRRTDLFTLAVFGGIFTVLLLGIAAVYMMQVNSLDTVRRENMYKVQYAKNTLESTIESVKATIVGVSDNTSFTQALEKNDLAAVNSDERIIFESNSIIRRLIVLDRDGKGYNLYPYGTFDQPDLSFRDYFIHARDIGGVFVTGLFQAQTDQSRRQVVIVSTPLYGVKHKFLGVLAAFIDLDTVNVRVQKIAIPDRREYIVVVDSKGKRILHANSKLVGTTIDKSDPTMLGLQGQSGIVMGVTDTGERALIAYDSVQVESANWGIALKSPIVAVYQLTDYSTLSLFSIVIVAVVIAGGVLQGGFFYRQRVRQGGSP